MRGLDRIEELARRAEGLAVAVTLRADGSPRASVVNAGVLDHPVTGERSVGFVSRGAARKLRDLRGRPHVTLVFRSGWEWASVEGVADLSGPDDRLPGIEDEDLLPLLRTVYAAAVGGRPEDWASLDRTLDLERHTAVLLRAPHVYPSGPGP